MKKKSFYFEDYNDSEFDQNKNISIIKVSLKRVAFLAFIFFGLLFIFSTKIIYLSLTPESSFYSNSLKKKTIKERRNIIDSNGSILATNVILYDVGVRPKLLKEKEKKNLLIKLGLLFPDLNLQEIKNKLNKDDFFRLEKD